MKQRTLMLIVAVEVLLLPLALWAGDEAAETPAPQTPPRDVDALGAPPEGPPDGPPHGPPHGRGNRDRRRELNEEEIEEVLDFIQAHWPEYHSRLLDVRENNPRRFRMMIRAAAHRMEQFEGMSEQEREARIRQSKVKVEIYRLSAAYREADNETTKNALREEIRLRVAEAFDLDQKLREYGLARLEAQLRELRKELQSRAERREAIIAEHMEDILQPGR
jgi:hypothetical protein